MQKEYLLRHRVATALTACGIVTKKGADEIAVALVATALTACGIVTIQLRLVIFMLVMVATALTACGIVTIVGI